MSEFKLLLELNKYHIRNISDDVIGKLISFSGDQYCLSGDDSGLTNLWEEVCVQIQSEYSFYWQSYDITIENVIEEKLESLPLAVKRLISYIQSSDESSSDQEVPFIYREDWTLKAVKRKVMERAREYENEAILNYLNGKTEDNEEED